MHILVVALVGIFCVEGYISLTGCRKREGREVSEVWVKVQKQSPGGVLWKRFFYKFRKIHRKAPVLEQYSSLQFY